MPLTKLQFKPGINRNLTNYSNEGGWFECDKVRFLDGYPEKLKGWQKHSVTSLSGTCRGLFNWVTSFNDNFLAIGTNSKLYIEVGTNLNDITPIRTTTSAGDVTFDATAGSTIIVATDASHGADTGDFVTFSGATALGGLITADVLNQNYEITKIDTNNYSFSATATANSSDTGNGGSSAIGTYEIDAGNGILTLGYGWGTDNWNSGGWGEGSLQPVSLPITVWFFDNFDNDLLANVNTDGKGALYYWSRGAATDPASALGTRAVKFSSITNFAGSSVTPKNVPALVGQILVSQKDRHLLVFGASAYAGGTPTEDTGDFDPLLIRFASQNEPYNFDPADDAKSAGFIRVSSGSKIISAISTRQEILVFTDSSLHSLQFLGTFDVFGLQELDPHISIASARSPISIEGVTYWMGTDKFYIYNGKVDTLPCTLRDHVFDNINFDALAYVYAGAVESQNEIWWFYPSQDSNINDSYVTYNYKDNIWFYGSIERSAWLDSSLRRYPQATGESFLFNHELGNDADGSALSSFITSSDVDIADGDKFTLIKRIIPDIDFKTSTTSQPTALLSVLPRDFNGAVHSDEAEQRVVQTSVNNYTNQVYMRARARQIGFKIESTSQGTFWKLGSPRVDGKPDGRR